MNNFVLNCGNINEFNGLRMGLGCLIFVQASENVKQKSYPQASFALLRVPGEAHFAAISG